MCKRIGLSQQKLADLLGEKRGKVAGYFYNTQSKSDFHQKLVVHFHIDLGKFLTIEMNDLNYESFFTTKNDEITTVNEPAAYYGQRTTVLELLQNAKQSENKDERDQYIDEVMAVFMRALDANDSLRDEILKLQQQLLDLTNKE